MRSVVVLFLFSSLLFAELSRAHENCGTNGKFVDNGLVSGCEKSSAEGKKTRFGKWIVRGIDETKIQEVNYNEAGEQDGLVRRYYPPESGDDSENQNILEETYYKKNIPDGTWTYFYANGQKKEERRYTHGRLHGLRKSWNTQGTPNGEQCFIDDVRRRLEDCAHL